VLSGSREAGVFDLTNAVGERSALRALRALRSLLTQREPAVMIVGLLANELRQLLLARCLIDARLDGRFDEAIPYPAFQSRILPRLRPEPEADGAKDNRLAEIHPFRLYNLLREAARFGQGELLAGLEAAALADLALKTSGRPEAMVLEELILGICAVR
jgi:DNA polymerase III delta subunit